MPQIIADIAVPVNLFRTFHYLIPHELSGKIVLGSRVLVPLGSRRVLGTVVGFPDTPGAANLKYVIEIVDEPLPSDLLKLAFWMSEYYIHPIGLTIETVAPKTIAKPHKNTLRLLKLIDNNRLEAPRGQRQAALFHLLRERRIIPLSELTGFAHQTIKTLCKNRVAEIIEETINDDADITITSTEQPPVLMPEQAEAVRQITEAVRAGVFSVFLLHGVTGSGKTEVYLRCVAELAAAGKGSIVLVPEIALTPQLLNRFRRRFGKRVAVLHSGLTDRERAREYLRIREGTVDVAVGARSAVFAPFKQIGLIIVDEEQENTYKQDDGLRYHARDVAVMRAKLHNTVSILGSATPSLESFANAKSGKYRYICIPNRVDHRPMPSVELIDRRKVAGSSAFSQHLIAAVRDRIERHEQVLLLLNRRGFSPNLICAECGAAFLCPSCSVSLVFHKNEQKLKCHYCGFYMIPPDKCPSCSGVKLKPLGTGTQKIEEEAFRLFPEARIIRMDSDNVRGRSAYEELLGKVDRGEADILLGTQMVAKGHDFPAMTLVGVLDADVGLNLPDFRSAEKTFQLITQAAGRSGRGATPGQVIIQTLNPGHYALVHSAAHDYNSFYDEEMRCRTELKYPPLRRMIRIEIKGSQEKLVHDAAFAARDHIQKLRQGKDTVILGPAQPPIAKVRGKHRLQLLLLSSRRENIRILGVEARKVVEKNFGRKVQTIIDVDPVNMM